CQDALPFCVASSRRGGHPKHQPAKVAELADAPDLGSGGVTPVGVRVPPFAPSQSRALAGINAHPMSRSRNDTGDNTTDRQPLVPSSGYELRRADAGCLVLRATSLAAGRRTARR